MNVKIGIIGLGRLGAALARGLARAGHAEILCGYNRGATKARALAAQVPALRLCMSEADVLRHCDLTFLWTKPTDALQVLETNAALIHQRRPMLVTCVIGVPLAQFTDRWAECLPNVNMPVGRGVTLLHLPAGLTEPDRQLVVGVLASVGSVHVLPPEEIPFYSALSSCGPALFATLLEEFADTLAAHRGYDRALCRRMVRETVRGTIDLQDLDDADAAEIVQRVAHPGGPSEAGVAYLRAELPAMYEAMLQNMRKW